MFRGNFDEPKGAVGELDPGDAREATGESVSADQVLQETDDLEEGTISWLGLRFRVTFPGLGVVLLDAGKIVFDADGNVVFEAGPHQVVNGGLRRVLRGAHVVAWGARQATCGVPKLVARSEKSAICRQDPNFGIRRGELDTGGWDCACRWQSDQKVHSSGMVLPQ